MDLHGKPATIKSIKKVQYYQIDDQETETSGDKMAKLVNNGQQIEIEFEDLVDMKWTNY